MLKESFGVSSKGRTATWYSAIKDCIHLFNPEVTYNNTLAVRIPSVPVSTDRRKKEWIITNCLQDGYTIGKIDYKSPSARTLSVIHWSCCAVELDLYSPCPGCLLNTNVVSHSNCSFSIRNLYGRPALVGGDSRWWGQNAVTCAWHGHVTFEPCGAPRDSRRASYQVSPPLFSS